MNINYCLECASPLSALDITHYACGNGHDFWNNPRTGAAVVFLRGNHVLLSLRGIEPHKGKYALPGGFLTYGEDARDAAIREMREETGVTITKLSPLGVQTVEYEPHETVCTILFLAEIWEGEFTAGDDSAALAWMSLDTVDEGQFAWPHPGLAAKLKELTKAQTNATQQPVFRNIQN